jgi:hypothetical protein
MSSKLKMSLFLLSTALLSFSSCTDFLKSKKTNDEVITVESNEECLKNFPKVFDRFLDSKSDKSEIDEALVCLNSTLTRFQNKFRGKEEKDVFTTEDITTIFNFFFKDLKISNETSKKLIRFKYALVGGEDQSLSKIDIENLKEFLKALGSELKKLSPWVAVFRNEREIFSEEKIISAYAQLRISLKNLINSGHISKTQYSIEDFILLLRQFNFNLTPYSGQIQQLLIAKKIFIGDEYVKSKQSYSAAIELFLDLMQIKSLVENHHYQIDFKKPETQKKLTKLISSVLELAKNSPLMKVDQFLMLQDIKDLVKLENQGLSYENLLTIKLILFGGQAEILTAQEVALFETNGEGLVESFYRISDILNRKSFSEIIAAIPQLQQQINYLSEKTFLDAYLSSPEHSEAVYSFIENFLSASNDSISDGTQPDYKMIFKQVADPITFSTKENILGFLTGLTDLFNLMEPLKSLSLQPIQSQIQTLTLAVAALEKTVGFKKNQSLDLIELMKQLQTSSESLSTVQTFTKLLFPKINLSEFKKNDMRVIGQFLNSLPADVTTLMHLPASNQEFELFKASLKSLLAKTDFYSNAFKSHEVIAQLMARLGSLNAKDFGGFAQYAKDITSFLTVLTANREIRSFEDINSILNSVFAAFQLYKKTMSAEAGFSFEFLQDVSSLLLVSDAMRINKSLNFAELLKVIESLPQSAASASKVKKSLIYLKLIFPKINIGRLEQSQLKKMVVFTLVLAQEKNTLSSWPTSLEQSEKFKKSIENVLAVTEFYSGGFQSHQILTNIIEALIEGEGNSFDLSGLDKSSISNYMNLLISDREIRRFSDVESILNTFFKSLTFYQVYIKTAHPYDAQLFRAVSGLLADSDQMQNEGFIRLDFILELMEKLAPDFLRSFNLTREDLVRLKLNLFAGNENQLTRKDFESLGLLIKFSEGKNSVLTKGINLNRILKVLTDSNSVERLLKILSPGSKLEPVSLIQLSNQFFKLAANSLKIKSEFDQAGSFRDYTSLVKNVDVFLSDLSQVPLFKMNQVLDLRDLQKILKDVMDFDLIISDELLKIKVYALGGDPYRISNEDLQRLRRLIAYYVDNEKDFYAALKVFQMKSDISFSMDQVDQAASVIKEKLNGAITISKISEAKLAFSDVFNLQRNLVKNGTLNEYEPLILTFHQLFIGPHFNYSMDHFSRLINSYVEGLKIIRYSQLGFAQMEIKSRESMLSTMRTLTTLMGIFENSISYAVVRGFDTKYFDSLLTFLIDGNYISYKVPAQVFISFYKRMLNTVFSRKPVKISRFRSITSEHLSKIKNELILFNFNLRVLDEAISRAGTDRSNIRLYNTSFKRSMIDSYEQLFQKYKSWFANDLDFFDRVKANDLAELKGAHPVIFSNGYVLSPKNYVYTSTWADHVRAQYMKTLARLLIQGWGTADQKFIEAPGLVKWYSDFKEFGIAVKSFDPRSYNSGERSMIEANLFAVSGNGDNRMDFIEATQFVSLLMTGGGIQFNKVYQLAESLKCSSEEVDLVGYPYLKEACLLNVYSRHYDRIFYNINWFVDYLKNMASINERFDFFKDLLNVARNSSTMKPGHVESADIKTMNMILMYIESTFLALDTNKNSLVSADELRMGYDRFDNLIFHIATKKSGGDLKAFAEDTSKWICRPKDKTAEQAQRYLAQESFIYLIYNGRLPEQNDMLSLAGLGQAASTAWNCAWNKQIFTFTGEVDRKMMINTFKLMKSVLASEK